MSKTEVAAGQRKDRIEIIAPKKREGARGKKEHFEKMNNSHMSRPVVPLRAMGVYKYRAGNQD